MILLPLGLRHDLSKILVWCTALKYKQSDWIYILLYVCLSVYYKFKLVCVFQNDRLETLCGVEWSPNAGFFWWKLLPRLMSYLDENHDIMTRLRWTSDPILLWEKDPSSSTTRGATGLSSSAWRRCQMVSFQNDDDNIALLSPSIMPLLGWNCFKISSKVNLFIIGFIYLIKF